MKLNELTPKAASRARLKDRCGSGLVSQDRINEN